MDSTETSVFLSICFGAISSMALAPSATAAPKVPTAEVCGGDDPMPCIYRHGEAAAKTLLPAYADLASKLDTACSDVPSPGMSACLERAEQIANDQLNKAYGYAMKSIGNGAAGYKWRERLKLAQQAWLRFREADCGDLTISEWSGRAGMGPAIITCQLGHTEARVAELNRRYGEN